MTLRRAKPIRADQGDSGGDHLGMLEAIRSALEPADDAPAVRTAIDSLPDDYVLEIRDVLLVALAAVLDGEGKGTTGRRRL